MIKYRTYGDLPKIKAVRVSGETLRTVTIDRDEMLNADKRRPKRGVYENYFDTWAEAHAHLIAMAELSVTGARRRLQVANSALGNIKGMKEPK